MALSVMRMDQDNPMRRHMQDSAQYGLAVAGTIIKAGRAIYDAYDMYVPPKPPRADHHQATP